MPTKTDKDAYSGRPTTGHEWDGIQELNTPLPKWWLYVLYATILWSIAIFILYPSIPLLKSYWPGLLGSSQTAELEDSLAAAHAVQAPYNARIANTPLAALRRDPELSAYAIAGGRTLFAENCAGCHGPGGAGRTGFPSLADDEWLWSGKLADLQETIAFGIRSGHDKGRFSEMPRFGTDKLLTPQQIDDVTEFVLSLSQRPHEAKAAERGAPTYADQCASCHGGNGGGDTTLGAPALNDQIWLYGSDRTAIARQIAAPRQGVMPAWSGRLNENIIKMLSIYVHSLGGGEPE